jgi:hypothetical protein
MKPPSIVMEFLQYGELFQYINDHAHGISWNLRLKFSLDIANGVNFLQSMLE